MSDLRESDAEFPGCASVVDVPRRVGGNRSGDQEAFQERNQCEQGIVGGGVSKGFWVWV